MAIIGAILIFGIIYVGSQILFDIFLEVRNNEDFSLCRLSG